jgi:NitT/TauT family transport system permease protein
VTEEPNASKCPPILTLRRVGKTFANSVVALDQLDLEVRAGEFVSLLGPSGCGKSTALRLIAALSEPSRGEVFWGSDAGEPRNSHAIGFVFQEPTLMPWATVFANVSLPLRLKGIEERTAGPRIASALEGVGLADFADTYPRELSGGMRMRVSLARALVTDPELLLMDEPFSALDEITRFRLNNDLLALWQALGKTIVFVTHSVFESVYLSNRIVVLTPRPGRVFAEIAIDVPYPRDESFRTSAEYAGFCRKTSLALGILVWHLVVEINRIPPYVLPGPVPVARTLVTDWPVLSASLLVTLLTTIEGLALAAGGGIALAILFNQSRLVEYSLYPYAVILQVTPIVAIAPLLLIYLPQQAAVLACAWIVAFFPVLANTTLGLNSVDHNLADLFRLYGASRWQTLRYLKLPTALPYMLGGLRIAGGLALIGAVVAEIAAGSAGAGSGLAYRIAESGYRLEIPRMFAALVLLALTGVVIYFAMSLLSHLVLRRWHESAIVREA